MSRLRYIADNPRGPRGGNRDVRSLFSSADAARRNTDRSRGGRVLQVDLDLLLVCGTDIDQLFQWHENQAQFHTSLMNTLKPGATGIAPAATWLDSFDLAQIREVVSEWVLEEDRLRLGGGATPAARGAFFVMWDLYRAGKFGRTDSKATTLDQTRSGS